MSNADTPDPEHIEILTNTGGNWQPVVGGETIDLLDHLSVPDDTKATIRDEAAQVLSRGVPPENDAGQDTGLVVGYVQSGKTMSFTTVAALAKDNGYAMVIIIAGTTLSLTGQSQSRLRTDLRIDSRQDRSWRLLHNPNVSRQDQDRINTTLADWRDPAVPPEQRQTVLITVMKNHQHLRHLINVLRHDY